MPRLPVGQFLEHGHWEVKPKHPCDLSEFENAQVAGIPPAECRKGREGALNYITVRKILKGNMNLMKREMEAIKKNQVELLEKEIQYLK